MNLQLLARNYLIFCIYIVYTRNYIHYTDTETKKIMHTSFPKNRDFRFGILSKCSYYDAWYLYHMVTQDMLRTHEIGISEKKIRFVTALDLIKYLKQIKYNRFLLTYAPISELPSNISTMF